MITAGFDFTTSLSTKYARLQNIYVFEGNFVLI